MVFGLCFAAKKKAAIVPPVNKNDVEQVKRFEQIRKFYELFSIDNIGLELNKACGKTKFGVALEDLSRQSMVRLEK